MTDIAKNASAAAQTARDFVLAKWKGLQAWGALAYAIGACMVGKVVGASNTTIEAAGWLRAKALNTRDWAKQHGPVIIGCVALVAVGLLLFGLRGAKHAPRPMPPNESIAQQVPVDYGTAVKDAAGRVAQTEQTCHVAGDNVAVGLARYMPKCTSDAKEMRTTLQTFGAVKAGAAVNIISVGMNPAHANLKTMEVNARVLRSGLPGRVVWVLPANAQAAKVIAAVAATNGDKVVVFKLGTKGDQLHPRSYPELARDVAKAL